MFFRENQSLNMDLDATYVTVNNGCVGLSWVRKDVFIKKKEKKLSVFFCASASSLKIDLKRLLRSLLFFFFVFLWVLFFFPLYVVFHINFFYGWWAQSSDFLFIYSSIYICNVSLCDSNYFSNSLLFILCRITDGGASLGSFMDSYIEFLLCCDIR